MFPKGHKLPDSFYSSKKVVAPLGLGVDKIDACENDCMLYWKDDKVLRECKICHHPRFKPNKRGGKKRHKDVPMKQLSYLPLIPRLQRLYTSKTTAEHMSWHKDSPCEDGKLYHPRDGEAWKHFDRTHPTFADEARNVRLALSSDGFNPHNQTSRPYSCWPVIVTPYNLPPWMCMDQPYMFLTLLVPGPRSPGKSLDVYFQPLIDELETLWNDGVGTYDVSKKQNFQMRAALMWTINDFPAYEMLSGWSTHGKLACPYCMNGIKSFRLKHGGKPCFFDCHRQFLPLDHPYRYQKDNFTKGRLEMDSPLIRLTGEELKAAVASLPNIQFGKTKDKERIEGFGETHNWLKRSKTKDNVKSRLDLQNICKRRDLELKEMNGKYLKPKTSYTLSKDERQIVLKWIKNLRLPDGSRTIGRNDNVNQVESSSRLSVFKCLGRPFSPKDPNRTLSPPEKAAATIYIILNCPEISEYVDQQTPLENFYQELNSDPACIILDNELDDVTILADVNSQEEEVNPGELQPSRRELEEEFESDELEVEVGSMELNEEELGNEDELTSYDSTSED
ncbi:hypothetical protein BUALT_Bualt11G0012600 [Buddleja alternifolia]|uniref:Transposase n=1 Tax=Buddleja alternifolia TaxID=168488 RepID=A0AAV6WS11_9LAMI|nr:hypothetical protein BUALT_Bualt11G0012600 [Buddleja alternifolia]